MKSAIVRHALAAAVLPAVLLFSGCASTVYKGSPFYSAQKDSLSTARANLWPAAYYNKPENQNPTLSVLWPVVHYEPDALFAVRPLLWLGKDDQKHPTLDALAYLVHVRETYGWVGPAWWSDHTRNRAGDSAFGVFPLFASGRDYFWAGAGLAGWTANEKKGGPDTAAPPSGLASSWVFPLYYRDDDLFLTPLWGRGNDGFRIIPSALSWWTTDEHHRSYWFLSGLAHWERHEDQPASNSDWILPFWYREGQDTFLTPLLGKWDDCGAEHRYWLTPLAGTISGTESGEWLFPLYHRSRSDTASSWRFLTAFSARDGEDSSAGVWPLRTVRHRNIEGLANARAGFSGNAAPDDGSHRYGSRKVSWLGGFAGSIESAHAAPRSESASGKQKIASAGVGQASWFFPLFSAGSSRERTWRRESPLPEETRKSSFFSLPYASEHRETESPGRIETSDEYSVLSFLYESRRDAATVSNQTDTVVSRRVLRYLWNCERRGGNLSWDAFPAVSYDRRDDGFRRFSLLWRLFRSERGADGSAATDIFFLPVHRRKPAPRKSRNH
jgi:hypothetical protein